MDRPLAPTGWRSHGRRLAQGMLPVTLIGMVISLTGCAYGPHMGTVAAPYQLSNCQCISDMRLRWQARSIWKEKYQHCYGDRAYAHDIKQGFIDGFVATAKGGSGCPPIMAPQRYSSGLGCLTHRKPIGTYWFQGYPLGAIAAESCAGEKCYASSLNPQLLACLNEQGCNPGCRTCEPNTDCQGGQTGCGGGCGSQAIFGTTTENIRNGMTDSDGAVVIEHSTSPIAVPAQTLDGQVPQDALPAPSDSHDNNAPPMPQPIKDANVDRDHVSETVPTETPIAADPSTVEQRVSVVTPIELPNMQVRFDLEESDWLFGDIDVARSLLQIDATSERRNHLE